MKLIVGLGNPGKEYENTRHNLGFKAVDLFLTAVERGTGMPIHWKKAYGAFFWKGEIDGVPCIFMEPQTYMNLSGDAVVEMLRYHKIDAKKDLVLVHDEIDLPLGEVRVQKDISSAGHNGVKSVIERIGHQDFTRIRIGIGRPSDRTPVEDFVVQPFQPEEKTAAADAVEKAALAIKDLLQR